ncbi:helix-turn-helix domain-containing protein [Streptomyces sp. DSM 42041]|uniref:Helix-turn-helix domain-containing protein n=1 Tax=Streptomyces hazeniae TaxID=3075538 RepID=A0ABU2NRG9_9ACTN|nr:helix-turn-helix domain-containing protein [Streptomyces sp. DSM 42041]MDT0378602.1 helix-turn-helix domain-containing protein [Streptomyces sp. DSM 42041]
MPRTSTLTQAARIEPDPSLREALERVAERRAREADAVVRYADGTELRVPSPLLEVLRAAAGELSQGHAVTILATETELTPAEAAALLGLSRPFVVRLFDEGAIPSTHLPGSRHRVVRLDDVLAFAERRRRRQEGRRRISDVVEDTDLPY